MSRGQNRRARREPVRKAYADAVDRAAKDKSRAWLEQHPPHAEVPVSTGTWRSPDLAAWDNFYEVEFGPAPRPDHLVHRVPIMPSAPERLAMFHQHDRYPANHQAFRTFDMRAVQWGTTVGQTRLRWWNWEPVAAENDAEAEAMHAAHGARAMMDLLTPHVEFLAKTDPSGMRFMWSAPGDRFPLPGDVALRYWREAIDLLGTWLGLVRTRYVVPGRDGRPEERLTEGRRP